ncbi:MAG TPA: dienelactone hydrolase family protein [Vicinamibacterales bacterium]|nr:dienelactone hydrolase family protein [Vicinamibacterales bacterium]
MNRVFKILLLVAVVAGIVMVVANRRGHATSPEVAPSMNMTNMTAAEHLEHLKAMSAAGDIHAGHALDEFARGVAQAAPANAKLPADDMGVVARLASSPRKGEYVNVMVDGKPMRTWVVHPAGNGKAPVVVVIMEIFGLSDWIRGVADQLAAEGFIAVAPDIVVGHGKDGGDTSSLSTNQEITQAVLQLQPAEIMAKLKAAREWGLKDPRSNGKSASVGYCFGGAQSFAFAVAEPNLNAAVVYYGQAPTDAPQAARGTPPAPYEVSERVANIKAPIIGFYGGLMQDARIGNTVAPTEAKMKALGKTYEPHIFDGAAHGFLRAQTGNDGANMKATEQAWPMTVAWLKKYTS